jgi:uncharacterized protein (DUF58 family)
MDEQKTKPPVKHDLKCAICGNKTGEVEIAAERIPEGATLTDAMLGIEENRCDTCTADYGSYQEMEILFKRDIKNDHEEFRARVQEAGRKMQPLFDTLAIDYPDRVVGRRYDELPHVRKASAKFHTDAGLAGMKPELQIEAVKAAKAKSADLAKDLRDKGLQAITAEAGAIKTREAAKK